MKEITYKDLPITWAFCFNEKCSKKDSCMKYLTSKLIPKDVSIGRVVLPSTYSENPCEHYHEKRIITVAWGFDKLFYDVKGRETAEIRQEMMNLLGSRSAYYRYATGKKLLTPDQQQQILAIFHHHGYTENLTFDHYEDIWEM